MNFGKKLRSIILESLLEPTRDENRSSGVRKLSVNLRLQEQCADVAHVTENRHGDNA